MIYKEIQIDEAVATTYVLSNYEAIDINRRRAMVIICPGGAYRHCSPREAEAVAIRFNSMGYNAMVINYTINGQSDPDGIWPKPQLQVALAIRYVREHAKELNTDPNKIALMGFSAGGHLAASIGVHWKTFGGEIARPNALVLCYPVITSGEKAHRGSIDNLIGEHASLLETVSLEKHVDKDTPPTFIWTTKTDNAVPYENSVMFKDALDKSGVENEFVLYETGVHGLSLGTKEVMDATRPEHKEVQSWPEKADSFLVKVFGSRF